MSEKEYRKLLKECGMCTKKWTPSKIKQLKNTIKEYMEQKPKTKKRRINDN